MNANHRNTRWKDLIEVTDSLRPIHLSARMKHANVARTSFPDFFFLSNFLLDVKKKRRKRLLSFHLIIIGKTNNNVDVRLKNEEEGEEEEEAEKKI